MNVPEPEDLVRQVRGERGSALVNAARSVQSRLSSLLAAGLMIVMGVSALTWYYAHAISRHRQARAAAAAGSSS